MHSTKICGKSWLQTLASGSLFTGGSLGASTLTQASGVYARMDPSGVEAMLQRRSLFGRRTPQRGTSEEEKRCQGINDRATEIAGQAVSDLPGEEWLLPTVTVTIFTFN
jgi:hypothetical protein